MLIARMIADRRQLETHLAQATAALAEHGMAVAMARMVEFDGDVLHLSLPGGDPAVLRRIVEDIFAPSAGLICDHEPEIPKLFISDMDSTMIQQECIDELAEFAGLRDRVAAITERAMRGEIDFAKALGERVRLLAGLEEHTIAQCLANRIHLTTGARILVQTLKAKGAKTALVTGGFYHFADPVAQMLGFDRVAANGLAVADGRLTGDLDGPIADSETKLAVLTDMRAAFGQGRVLAAGDGANDIPMLQAADYGFAYRAKPAARNAAAGWVDDGDLTVYSQTAWYSPERLGLTMNRRRN